MDSSTAAPRPRPRPAHTEGITRCAYNTDGSRLVTAGSNNTIRLYKTGSDGEPANIDNCQEQNVSVASGQSFFISGSEDGILSLYSIENATYERYLLRTSLPVRGVALSKDEQWCAAASDELSIKLVHTQDTTHLKHLREHNCAARHISFDPLDSLATVSCTDGIIYVYSLTADEPELIKKIDGIIGAADSESEISTQAVWHPDGRAFAAPTPTRDIQVISKGDWEKQRSFSNGHTADITALAWSPNGSMLASASKDGSILIWETKTQSVIQRYEYSNVIDLAWHPNKNILSFTTTSGEVYIYPDFIPAQYSPFLKLPVQPAPFIHDPLGETSGNRRAGLATNGQKVLNIPTRTRRGSAGSLDSLLDHGAYEDEGDDGFVVDDDGAGYTAGNGLKRGRDEDIGVDYSNKRRHMTATRYHEAFQPGSTPWRGNRKYLCLNLIGFIWTVDQDDHHTVTVEFYDHEFHRDFHFTDTFLYDKACLNESGSLFSCPPTEDTSAAIFYRPHQTWTQRADWRTHLPRGEAITAMSLSESFITVTTTANYVRVFTLFGVPHRVYRPKSSPMVTCASFRDYVMTVGNGPVSGDGSTRLLYTIENVKRDTICQNEDTVALPEGATLKSVFFSDKGDPCIYDSTGTLLTLLHWRQPSRASWVPLLDTKLMSRLASGRKNETYFPIAVADDKFHCIILKGGDQYPYFPRPLLSEFNFEIPVISQPREKVRKERKRKASPDGDDMNEDDASDGGDDDDNGEGDKDEDEIEARRLEQQYLLKDIQAAQVRDLAQVTTSNRTQRSLLSQLEFDIDKTLLQMLAVECRAGEDRGMRALEMVELMRDRTGRMMEAAGKVADRYQNTILGEKIREIGEKRVGYADNESDGEF